MYDLKFSELARLDVNTLSQAKNVKSNPLEAVGAGFFENIMRSHSAFRALPAYLSISAIYGRAEAVATHQVVGKFVPSQEDMKNQDLYSKHRMALTRLVAEYLRQEVDDLNHVKSMPQGLIDNVTHLLEGAGRSTMLFDGTKAMISSIIVSTWSAFEVLAADLWVAAVNDSPARAQAAMSAKEFKNLEQTLSAEISKSVNQPSANVASILKRRLSFQKINGIERAYEILLGDSGPQLFRQTAGGHIVALAAVRNLIVHKNGVVDEKFAEQVRSFPELSAVQIGTNLQVDGGLAVRLSNAAIQLGVKLLHALDMK